MSLENKDIKQFDIFYKDIYISGNKNNRPCIILTNIEKALDDLDQENINISYIHLTSQKNKWENNQIKLENYNSYYNPKQINQISYNELKYIDLDENIILTAKDHQNLKKAFPNII